MRVKIMQFISRLVFRRYQWVLLVCLLLSVFMYFSYTRLELKLNFVDMLSPDDPAVIQYRHAVEQFGALSFLFIVVESDDLDKSKLYADELARALVRNPDFVPRVYHKLEIKNYLDDALLFLKPSELSMLADFLEKNREPLARLARNPSLSAAVEAIDQSLKSYIAQGELPEMDEELDFRMVFDPLAGLVNYLKDYALHGPKAEIKKQQLKKTALSRMVQGGESLPIDLSEPYILSKDKKKLLMLVSTARPAEDFEWCRQLMEYVEAVAAETAARYPGVRTYMTGNAAVMRADNVIIRHDMKVTTAVAFVCIMLLFAFSFRNLSSIFMVALPLAVGILWSLGAAYWVVGHLTPITAIFGAILLGLGIDYAILILSRYTEERHRGKSIQESLDITMTQTGVSILTGAIATCLAFFSLTQATFNGGKEMGIVAGTGIIMFVLIMSFGLSSLLVWWDRRKEHVGPTQKRFNPRLMRIAARVVDRHPVSVFLVLASGCAFLAAVAPRYQFEYNYLNLEPQHVEAIQLIHKIPEWFGIDTNYGMVISHSVEEDRELAAKLRAKSTVSKVEAISDFIPEGQEEKLKLIRRMKEAFQEIPRPPSQERSGTPSPLSEEEFSRLLAALKSLRETIAAPGRGLIGLFYLAELEDAEEGARELLAALDSLIAALESGPEEEVRTNLGRLQAEVNRGVVSAWDWLGKMVSTRGITIESLKEKHPELIDRFQGKDGSFLIYAYPSLVIWNEHNLKAVARELKEVDPNAMGVAILFDRILDQIKKDLFRVALIALFVVFLALLVNYRGLWHTLLTLVPLVAGAVSMVGLMNLIGLKFNIVNMGMLPLVIGIGVDYGVYVVHRWIAEGKGVDSIFPVVESTGRAVSLSAFTTMIGFASIILAQWRGLSLMGATLTMGIGLCWVAAVFFLPSLLKILELLKARKKES